MMQPNLAATIEVLSDLGVEAIEIVPAFMAQGGHLSRDLPKLLDEARQQHPDITINLQATLGEVQTVIDAMARHVVASMR
jgi:sirohydrochlorin cobaltochelatase